MLLVFLKTAVVFALIFLGAVLRRRGVLDAALTRGLAVLLMTAFYPGLVFESIVTRFTIPELVEYWTLPAGSALIMTLGYIAGLGLDRLWAHDDTATRRTTRFQLTMNNYSFLPMVLTLVLLGQGGKAMVVYSTLGAELVVWTLGVTTLTGGGLNRASLRRLLTMPMLAMAASAATLLVLWLVQGRGIDPAANPDLTTVGHSVLDVARLLGGGAIPVSALVAGSRMGGLSLGHVASVRVAVLTVLRVIVLPAIVVAILLALPFSSEVLPILLIIAVMPCAITSVSLSEVYAADSDLAAATVLSTHVVAVITVPLWLRLLAVA